jgi:hypothetical protein
MRRWVLGAAAIIAASCGGGGSPTTPAPTGGLPLHLSPGPYTLTLDLSDGSVMLVCGPALPVTGATFAVVLERGAADLTVAPQTGNGSLRLRLQVSGDDRLISGTMFGSAVSEEGVTIEVFGATMRDPALISGRAETASVEGTIIGQLRLAGAACTSTGYNWKLTPRPGSRAE